MTVIDRSIPCVLTMLLTMLLAGCSSSKDAKTDGDESGASMDAVATAVDEHKAAKQQEEEDATAAKQEADQAAADAAAAPQPQAPAEPGKKVGGRPAPEFGGYFGAIAGARRHVMNVVDSLSWIQGVRSFKAEEGRKPKNNEEFMKVVVTKYDLQLPHIEEDEEYLYDPNGETDGDFGQLYVVKKESAASSAPAPGSPPTPSNPPAPK